MKKNKSVNLWREKSRKIEETSQNSAKIPKVSSLNSPPCKYFSRIFRLFLPLSTNFQKNYFVFFFFNAGKLEGKLGKFPKNTQKIGNFPKKILVFFSKFSDVSSIFRDFFLHKLTDLFLFILSTLLSPEY